MGLDMYAYSGRPGQYDEYWAGYNTENKSSPVAKPTELAYWRKHPNLHGWMERLWEEKGHPGSRSSGQHFNGIELELTEEDIARLEQDILNETLPSTSGFFFGQNADGIYFEQDIEFVAHARAELFLGRQVFYNSSW